MNLPKINTQRLIDQLLNVRDYPWRNLAEIIPNYKADDKDQSRCVIKYQDHFLRHSAGPRQGHFWDCYGEDYQNPELALLALAQSPPPPDCLKQKIWETSIAKANATKADGKL